MAKISDEQGKNHRKVESTVRYPYGTNVYGQIDNLEDALARFTRQEPRRKNLLK